MAARISRALCSKKGFLPAVSWPRIALGHRLAPSPLPGSSRARLIHTGCDCSQSQQREYMMMHQRISHQNYQIELLKHHFANFQLSVKNDMQCSQTAMGRMNTSFYVVVIGLLLSAYPFFDKKGNEEITGDQTHSKSKNEETEVASPSDGGNSPTEKSAIAEVTSTAKITASVEGPKQ